ncbi:MAG: zinc-binding dehydrogenase [Syntrophobacteraceae bacterium]|jgi:threonine dehydrogenase-like Zn-dependent dehydrogenase|nr:zinc-binding dehydrogenase [Syntrophobacteraceae bacterium]
MRALVYRKSIPLYLLNRWMSLLNPRAFHPALSPLRLQEVPFAPRKGWVVLRNRLCGICGSDLGLLRGTESVLLEPYASFPAIIGHEMVSEVVEAPVDSGFHPGDRVVVEPLLPCRARGVPPCRFCREGSYNLCESTTLGDLLPGQMGFSRSCGGGMAEFTSAPAENLFKIPEKVPDEDAVLADSVASALQPVLDHFPEDGHTVVVYGAGSVGQHILRCLRMLGSRARLLAVARHPYQRELALAGGADIVLMNPVRSELGAAAGARLLPTTLGGGNLEGGADLFLDCVGSSHSFQEGLIALRGRGTYVMVGTAGTLRWADVSSLWLRELRVTGSMAYGHGMHRGERVRTYELALGLLGRGDYPVGGLLTHVFPIEEYGRAFKAAVDKKRFQTVKVALDPRKEPPSSDTLA